MSSSLARSVIMSATFYGLGSSTSLGAAAVAGADFCGEKREFGWALAAKADLLEQLLGCVNSVFMCCCNWLNSMVAFYDRPLFTVFWLLIMPGYCALLASVVKAREAWSLSATACCLVNFWSITLELPTKVLKAWLSLPVCFFNSYSLDFTAASSS